MRRASPESYARALTKVLDESKDSEKAVKAFAGMLIREGRMSLVPSVLKCIEDGLVQKSGGRIIELEFARPNERLAETILELFMKKDKVRIKINPEIAAGARITFNGEKEINYSLQSRLRSIFK